MRRYARPCCPRHIHRIRHDVQAVAHQVAVEVEGHRRRLVAEHLLDNLHIGSAGDSKRSCGVAQRVRVHAGLGRGVPRPRPQAPPEMLFSALPMLKQGLAA